MKPEIIKYLLDLWFEVSTDWYLDSENRTHTYAVLCKYFQEDDYELWINYSKEWFTLNWIDFKRDIKIKNQHEMELLIQILKN